jgi:hypothetical protein
MTTEAAGPARHGSASQPYTSWIRGLRKSTSTRSLLANVAPILALACWTLFVWGGRIRNLASDDQLGGWALVWRAGLAGSFVAAALALLVLLGRFARRVPATGQASAGVAGRSPRPLPAALSGLATGVALVGTAVWLVRGVDIAAGDHSLGFKVVHLVLAVITLGLSGLVLRQLRATGSGPPIDRPAVGATSR